MFHCILWQKLESTRKWEWSGENIWVQIILSEAKRFTEKTPEPKSSCSSSVSASYWVGDNWKSHWTFLKFKFIIRKVNVIIFSLLIFIGLLWGSNEIMNMNRTLYKICNTDTWSCYIVASYFPLLLSPGMKMIYMHTDCMHHVQAGYLVTRLC